jgi:hypothetical protein
MIWAAFMAQFNQLQQGGRFIPREVFRITINDEKVEKRFSPAGPAIRSHVWLNWAEQRKQ